jgi:hypothetical protein
LWPLAIAERNSGNYVQKFFFFFSLFYYYYYFAIAEINSGDYLQKLFFSSENFGNLCADTSAFLCWPLIFFKKKYSENLKTYAQTPAPFFFRDQRHSSLISRALSRARDP